MTQEKISAKQKLPGLFIGICTVCLIAVFLYSGVLNAYFVSEDYEWWTRVRNIDLINSFRLFLPPILGGISLPPYFRPLVGWTVWLDTVVFGMTPLASHITSLIFHLINIALVGIIGFYIFRKSILAGVLGALFFSVFPFHPEAVVWSIGGRSDVVMATFYLSAFLGVMKYVEYNKRTFVIPILICFLLGLLSKEAAATFPLAVLVYLLFSNQGSIHEKLSAQKNLLVISVVVFIGYFVFRSVVLQTINPYQAVKMISSFTLGSIFQLYLILLLSSLLFRSILNRMVPKNLEWIKNKIWYLWMLIGITFLPTSYLVTQERQLYLPSAVSGLFLSGVIFIIYSYIKGKSVLIKTFFIISVISGLVYSGQLLYQRNEVWKNAGNIAQSIAGQLADQLAEVGTDKKVYFVNVPDSVNGAYIYRTHLQQAVEFLLNRQGPQLIVTPELYGTDSKVYYISPRNIRVENEQGFVMYLANKDRYGRFVKETPDYYATLLSKKLLNIEIKDQDFSKKRNLVYFLKNGKIELLE